MRFKVVCLVLVLCGLAKAHAQWKPARQWTVGLGYDYIHSNLRPGCNCFNLNGGTATVSTKLTPDLALEGVFQGAHSGNVSDTGKSLDLYTYLVGPRYELRPARSRLRPFGHLLLGASHAGGDLYGSQGTPPKGGYAFATLIGGGVELPVTTHLSLRPIQADYLLTLLPNGWNDRQNNISLSAGFALRFGGGAQHAAPVR